MIHNNSTNVIPFSRYNEEFSSLTNQIRSTLTSLETNSSQSVSVSHSTSAINHAHLLLSQTKELLKQMTIEARSVQDPILKEECLQLVRVAKTNQANLSQDIQAAQQTLNRKALISSSEDIEAGTNSGPFSSKDPARQHLLQTTDALSHQNQTLENARRIMSETEHVALEITEELGRNRETIESAHARVRGVSALTNQARRVLVSMQRREVQQKMVVYGMAGVLFVVFLFLLGFF